MPPEVLPDGQQQPSITTISTPRLRSGRRFTARSRGERLVMRSSGTDRHPDKIRKPAGDEPVCAPICARDAAGCAETGETLTPAWSRAVRLPRSAPPPETTRDDRDARRTAHSPAMTTNLPGSACAECVPKQPLLAIAAQVRARSWAVKPPVLPVPEWPVLFGPVEERRAFPRRNQAVRDR